MNPLLKRLVETASDAGTLAKSLRESGLGFVRGAVGGMPLAGSLFGVSSPETDRDERHYVLVPLPGRPGRFGIYSKRVLPPGHGPANSLDKVRVFHVPDEAGVSALEDGLVRRAVREKAGGNPSDAPGALERLAEEVDREVERISGGLLVVASTVCVVNPLLGLGVALPGFIAILGGKGAKVGLEKLGERVRRKSLELERQRTEKAARKDAARGTTETFVNPLLRALATAISGSESDYDPFLDEATWADNFESQRHFRIAVEGVCELNAKAAALPNSPALPPAAERWLRHLGELRSAWEEREAGA